MEEENQPKRSEKDRKYRAPAQLMRDFWKIDGKESTVCGQQRNHTVWPTKMIQPSSSYKDKNIMGVSAALPIFTNVKPWKLEMIDENGHLLTQFVSDNSYCTS